MNHSRLIFFIIVFTTVENILCKNLWWLDLNPGTLLLEVTALPNVPQSDSFLADVCHWRKFDENKVLTKKFFFLAKKFPKILNAVESLKKYLQNKIFGATLYIFTILVKPSFYATLWKKVVELILKYFFIFRYKG